MTNGKKIEPIFEGFTTNRRRIFQHFTYSHFNTPEIHFCRFNAFRNRPKRGSKWFNDNEKAIKTSIGTRFGQRPNKKLDKNKSMKYLKVLNADFERKILDDFNQHKTMIYW